MNQLNLLEARKERDRAIADVTEHNGTWHSRALNLLGRLAGSGREMTGEQMRLWLLDRGMDRPNRAHAWGALTRHACHVGLIRDSGKIAQMESVASHARRTPVWIFR